MHKSNVLTIRLPRDLKGRIAQAATQQGVSMNQFAIYAFTRGLGELEATQFFRERVGQKNAARILTAFDAVMDRIPERQPPAWDRPEGK